MKGDWRVENKMNWTIKEVRKQGYDALHLNYWKVCFMTTLMLVLSYGSVYTAASDFIQELPTAVKDIFANLESKGTEVDIQVVAVMITLAVGVLLLSTIFKIVLNIFVKNPVEIGVKLCMKKTIIEETGGMISDVGYAFDHDYLQHVKNMFVVNVVKFLYTLLLVIPGIYKGYEYRMVPYILSDDPCISYIEAMKRSSEMMKGNKKKALLFDLSFIPWHIAGGLTLGLLEVFFVNPYKNLADANLYFKLKEAYEENGKMTENATEVG